MFVDAKAVSTVVLNMSHFFPGRSLPRSLDGEKCQNLIGFLTPSTSVFYAFSWDTGYSGIATCCRGASVSSRRRLQVNGISMV